LWFYKYYWFWCSFIVDIKLLLQKIVL
jgi:hypothetical protein